MAETPENLQAWMRFGQPLEAVIGDFMPIFDAWEAMGVKGIVLGRMYFRDDNHKYHPIFDPNPRIYERLGVFPPEPSAKKFPGRRRQLDQLFAEAKKRKWSILIFSPDAGALTGPGGKHASFVKSDAWLARILDTLAQFPEVDGCIIDGPEWGYEIQPGHRANIFADLPESVRPLAESRHFDFGELQRARDSLHTRLHQLKQRRVGTESRRGLMGALRLFGSVPELTTWLRFRTETLTGTVKTLKGLMREQRKDLRLGMGPRSAAFAPLCGYDFRILMEHLDYLLPKHYFWHRGYDGFYGTVYRWMNTLTDWNPGLSDEQALQVVKAFFGINLPGLKNAFDFERGFPDEFFMEVVAKETTAALSAVKRPEQVVPWVDVGRRPHDGDPMGSSDFIRTLEASHNVGLRRFLYHNHSHLSPAEVEVMRALCGDPDQPIPKQYRPPDGLHEHVV